MKVLVLGGVAAGTKIAAKLMREDRSNEVTILNKGKNISYAGCGLPYYVGSVIEEKEQLIVNTPEKYEKLTGVKVFTEVEAVSVDREKKEVTAVALGSGEKTSYQYDKLVIATGASPVKPPVEGIDCENVFYMRTPEDAIGLREVIESGGIKRAVVVGGGYIGLEIAENLTKKGIRSVVIDMASHVLPGFDPELCEYVENHLSEAGIPVVTGVKVTAILGDGKVEKVQTDKRTYKADLVVMSAGIRPNTDFLKGSGIDMERGVILTNAFGQTNDENIYAAGDCAMVSNGLTNKPAWSPMGSTANIAGRNIAKGMNGKTMAYRGVLGTAVCKLPELNAGRTGLTEEQAKQEGFQPISVVTVVDDKAHYYPDAGSFIVKMIADRESKKLLGLQVLGKGSVDKMVDIAVTAIMLKATLEDLRDMDLAYAPPFSTAIHPFTNTLNVLMNKIDGVFETFTPMEYENGEAEGYKVIDGCLAPSIEGAPYVDLTKVEGLVEGFDPEDKILLVCNKGKRAYLLQNRMKFYGYKNTRVLEGGITVNEVTVK